MDNEILTYLKSMESTFNSNFSLLSGKIDTLTDEVHASCTTLAVHGEKISVIESRCSSRGEDVKRLDNVEKKLDTHILTNGFTDKEVKGLKAEIKPYSEWAVTGKRIMQFIGVLLILASFYASLIKPIFSKPKTTTTIEVTK